MPEQWDVVLDLRDGGDWSLDLCYAGLQLNGVKLLDVPYKAKHREWWGVIEGRRQSDWGLERRTLGFTGHDDRGHRFPGASLIEAEMCIRDGVRRVWLDERMESFQAYRNYGFQRAGVPAVVVAGHDRFWNHSPEFVASLYGDRLEAMLLDNWYPRYAELPFRVRPIGWSCNFDHYWRRMGALEKDIDISFIGYNSHPDRARYVDMVLDRFSHLNNHIVLEREADSFGKFVSKAEYFDVIGRSKVALNLRGAADRGKTMRAYEIPYVGSFMLSQRIEDPGMSQDFQHGVHCLYFDDEGSLEESIAWALAGPGYREQIAERGHQRALNELSAKHRWADVLGWLEDVRHL